MNKLKLKKKLEDRLQIARKSLDFAIENYTAALRLSNENSKFPLNVPAGSGYSPEEYADWLEKNLKFWNEDIEYWQDVCHKTYTRLNLTIW